MTLEKAQRLLQLTHQLAEALMTAAICADEIRSVVHAEPDGNGPVHRRQNTGGSFPSSINGRPLVDHSTLTVSWAGKTCYLGSTVLFRLADRLSRRPNQYIETDQLLCDVWEGGCKSSATIRSAVRNLRQSLTRAGMDDLAATIQCAGGRYGLILDGRR